MMYGRDPADADSKQKYVLSGEKVDIKLPEVNLPLIKEDLENLGYPDEIVHAQVMIESVTFTDGSMWFGDETLVPDPANPKKKINPQSIPDIQPPASSAVSCIRVQRHFGFP
ncbi:MAG: hypothetical protein WBD22_08295 [Pyrinomonadaceae bacterium]